MCIGAWFLATNNLLPSSEQQLVNCDTVDSSCNGELMDNASASAKKTPCGLRQVTLARPRGASKWRKWVAEMVSVIPVGLPDEGVSDVVDRFITDNHASS